MAGDVIVLDTHALLWWMLDPDKLSLEAQRVLEEMEKSGGIASSISIWELAIKVKRRKLALPVGVDELARRLEQTAMVELVPVDVPIWLRSVALDWEHRDPADRVIAATALVRGLPLLSKDKRLHGCPDLTCIW